MFEQYFGPYLVEKQILTSSELNSILSKIDAGRAKLGFLAVAENFITEAQAEELNQLQVTRDCRFGDIAVELGYLTKDQLSHLLDLQGNTYLKFVQALIEQNIMTYEKIHTMLQLFAKDYNLSSDELAAVKSDDVDSIISAFAKVDDAFVSDFINLTLRSIIRFVNHKLVIDKIRRYSSYEFTHFASQELVGDHKILIGFACNDKELLQIASPFGKENFTDIDEDSLDSVCEFINCCSGLFASKLSHEDVRINMMPPMFYSNKKISCKENSIFVVTIKLHNESCDLVVITNSAYDLN